MAGLRASRPTMLLMRNSGNVRCFILSVCLLFARPVLADTDHCDICGAPFNGPYYTVTDKVTHEKKLICHTCSTWPNVCSICGLPVRTDFTKLPDGRFLCARDAKTAVLNEDEAGRICSDVRNALDRLLGRFVTFPETNVDVAIVDRVNLMALFKTPGNDLECPEVLGYFQPRTNEDQVRLEISLMSALPRAEFKGVCAHEYSHAWVFENVSPERRQAIKRDTQEGFCELVAYLLMDAQHEEAEKKEIEQKTYSRGQVNLFIEAEKRYGFNDIVDWMKYGADSNLKKDDLSRIRNVELPRPASSPGAQIMVKTAEPPPAPDKLVLERISWINKQPLAIINGRTFSVGESRKVRVGKTDLFVRCFAIGTNSVSVEIVASGEKQELQLKSQSPPKPPE